MSVLANKYPIETFCKVKLKLKLFCVTVADTDIEVVESLSTHSLESLCTKRWYKFDQDQMALTRRGKNRLSKKRTKQNKIKTI